MSAKNYLGTWGLSLSKTYDKGILEEYGHTHVGCGGKLLLKDYAGEKDHHVFCNKCFAYKFVGSYGDFPSGMDESENRLAWEKGRYKSPPPPEKNIWLKVDKETEKPNLKNAGYRFFSRWDIAVYAEGNKIYTGKRDSHGNVAWKVMDDPVACMDTSDICQDQCNCKNYQVVYNCDGFWVIAGHDKIARISEDGYNWSPPLKFKFERQTSNKFLYRVGTFWNIFFYNKRIHIAGAYDNEGEKGYYSPYVISGANPLDLTGWHNAQEGEFVPIDFVKRVYDPIPVRAKVFKF